MDRNTAIELLGLAPEPTDHSWRYFAPTGQLVRLATKHALRPPRAPRVPNAAECNAVVSMFNALDSRQAAARKAKQAKALAEHERRIQAILAGNTDLPSMRATTVRPCRR